MAIASKKLTAVGMFDRPEDAERAVHNLVEHGIPKDDISLAAGNRSADDASISGKASGLKSDGGVKRTGDGTTVGENVAGGALFGGLGGLLLGIGALAIPGIGPIVAAGPIAAALAGAGIGAAGGGVIGALKDSGVPDDEANFYSEGLRRGGTLVTVRTDEDMAAKVSDILDDAGAVSVNERLEEFRGSGWNRFDPQAPEYSPTDIDMKRRTGARGTGMAGTRETIPVVKEELTVGKREVNRGGVRVYTHMQERPVEESVELRDETVHVERRPVDRPLSDADDAFRDRSIEVTETAEEAVVGKRARVVEEVVVSKDTQQRTETVRDSVRSTEVEVEQLPGSGTGRSARNVGTPDTLGASGNSLDYDTDFRQHFSSTYGSSGETYDRYEPAYRYGSTSAGDKRHHGKSFEDVEDTLKTDYLRNNPNSKWDNAKGAVRYGWEKVSGKR